jgi:hypothetical protein
LRPRVARAPAYRRLDVAEGVRELDVGEGLAAAVLSVDENAQDGVGDDQVAGDGRAVEPAGDALSETVEDRSSCVLVVGGEQLGGERLLDGVLQRAPPPQRAAAEPIARSRRPLLKRPPDAAVELWRRRSALRFGDGDGLPGPQLAELLRVRTGHMAAQHLAATEAHEGDEAQVRVTRGRGSKLRRDNVNPLGGHERDRLTVGTISGSSMTEIAIGRQELTPSVADTALARVLVQIVDRAACDLVRPAQLGLRRTVGQNLRQAIGADQAAQVVKRQRRAAP